MKTRTRRLLTLLLIAAMTMSLMVPALAVNTAQSETPYTYDAGDYTFGKISHADKAPGTPDGIVRLVGHRGTRDLQLTLRYKFNTTRSKYKGTGVGNAELNRL